MRKRVYRGKVIGAIAGALLLRANPLLGGLIGLLIGHAVDTGWFKAPTAAQPPAAPPPDNAYSILGVSAEADDAQIDLAYRRMMSQYHPDRLAQAAPELRKQAETRAREINAAYDRIRALRKRRDH